MTVNGTHSSYTYGAETVLGNGHPPVVRSGDVKASNGTYPMGLLVALDSSEDMVEFEQVSDEDIGTGEAAATAVADENIEAGDGSVTEFHGALANADVEPGSLSLTATVGAAEVTATDDGNGAITGDFSGVIDYTTGVYTLVFGTAPDNATNVVADYNHTIPTITFAGTLAKYPVHPGTVVVTDDSASETFSDDGEGNLTGDGGGSGTIAYSTGAISVTFAAAPAENDDVLASYDRKLRGVMAEEVNTSKSGSGNYVAHGSVRQDLLKVGITAESAPVDAVLQRLEDMGIWPE
jgi:hypothetical protein